jgi:hypothetical protein
VRYEEDPMAEPNLRYQTVQVEARGPMNTGPSPRGAALGARVQLLAKASRALNGWAVSFNANRQIEKLKPQILSLMSRHEAQARQTLPDLGVLLVVGIQFADPSKFAADPGQVLLGVHIGSVGTNFRFVLNQYIHQPKIVAGASKDWKRRDVFVWVTR